MSAAPQPEWTSVYSEHYYRVDVSNSGWTDTIYYKLVWNPFWDWFLCVTRIHYFLYLYLFGQEVELLLIHFDKLYYKWESKHVVKDIEDNFSDNLQG